MKVKDAWVIVLVDDKGLVVRLVDGGIFDTKVEAEDELDTLGVNNSYTVMRLTVSAP